MFRKVCILTILLLLSAFAANAQLSVNIIGDSFSGCSPQNLTFGCNVTGAGPNVAYSWSSGNGDVSQLATPTFSYLEGGTYTISVTITSSGHTATASREVVIFQSPEARFNETPVSGCTPFDYSLSDMSIQGDAPITSWLWYWGDGQTSTGQNVSHTYQNSGLLTVSLRVTDGNGCIGEHYAQSVNVSSPPSLSVTAEIDQWCEPPLQVPFRTDVTTAPNVSTAYTLTWDFGDGQTGTGDNLTHTYNSHGHFDVSVTATDSYGCYTTQVYPDMISIAALVPRFDAPSLACRKVSTAFRSLMSRSTNCSWNFGDGTPVSYDYIAYHAYMSEGTYTGTFTADPGGPCERSETFTVTVQYVEASFVVDETFSCDYPFTAHFTNTSAGDDISYRYDFGNGVLSSDENPDVTYYRNGVYETSMTAYTSAGCFDEFDGPTIIVNHPEAYLESNSCGDCIPKNIQFDHHVVYTENSEIVDYFWDFGDGTTLHTTYRPVNHTYTVPGAYIPNLTITDRNGCTDTRRLHEFDSNRCDTIEVGIQIPPEDFWPTDTNHIRINGDTVCPQDIYLLYNSMYESSDSIDFTILVDGAHGPANNMYNGFMFDVHTGWNNVGIMTEYLNCESDSYYQDRVFVLPPILHISYQTPPCTTPFDYTFYIFDNQGAQYWDWSITGGAYSSGDAQVYYEPHSTASTIHVTLPGYGMYECNIIGYNDNSGCTFTDHFIFEIPMRDFIWHMDPDTVCMGKHSSVEVDRGGDEWIAYNWGINDVPVEDLEWFEFSSNISHPHRFDEPGDYTVTVYLKGDDDCISIYTKPIYVVDPSSTIMPPSQNVCAPTTVEFECVLTNTDDPIRDVQWNFGNNETAYGNPITREYNDTGYYSIHYMVTTRHGCTDQQSFDDYLHAISNPELSVEFDDSICNTDLVIFTSNVENPDFSYTWDFGDGEIWDNSGPVVTHRYSAPGRYSVSLNISGGVGCTDAVDYQNGVYVESLNTSLSPEYQNFNCYPAEPVFAVSATALPDGTEPSFHWTMGNGDNLYVENPEYLYNVPGYYTVSFEVTTPAGCRVVKNANVAISGPIAEIYISDTAICAGDDVTFRMLNAQNVQSYQWVVGGGYNYTTPTVTHTYDYVPQSGYFPVVLSLTSGECSVDITEMIYVYEVDARFGLFADSVEITSGLCAPLSATLINQSSEDAQLRWYQNGRRLGESAEEVPVYWTNTSYNDSTFIVSLAVTNEHNCYDSVSHEYELFPSPHPLTSNDTILCLGDETDIMVVGGVTYYWEAPINNSNPRQSVTPTENTTYYVDVYTEHLCSATDSVHIDVIAPVEAEIDPDYASINIGDTIVAVILSETDLNCRWFPLDSVISIGCDTLLFFPNRSTDYSVWLSDSLGCYENRFDIHIDVEMKFSLDVPGAFTPLSEGDGNNIVYVRGLGIKRLLQFRIFNRWGEEVFFSDDLNKGWDGRLKGKVQNIDTYSYYVEAEMYDGSIRTKKGNLMLIK